MIFERPVGIDLGTTNSEIALLPPSERELVIYADKFGRRTVPSAVAFDPKVGVVVGHAARGRRGKTPPPIESIKRKMGSQAKVDLGGESLLPEEVSAKILSELKTRMADHLAAHPLREGATSPVVRAVITVPAYFDAPQMEATRKAGEIAGLEVLGILQEPTAAAIYHTWKAKLSDGNFLIYDLGGGTFDVSVLRCVGGEYQVLAIDGDNFLGGDDLDRKYAEHLRKELAAKGYSLDLDVRDDEDDRQRFARLVHLAQEIKESLSTSEVVSVSKESVVLDKAGESVSYEAEVSRADYEKVVGDLIETTITCCERALARSKETAGIGIEDIDHVILVGGSTRVPLVIKRVTEALCRRSRADKPLQDEVDTIVALGAAVHAAMLGGLRIEGDKGAKVLVTTPLVGHGSKLRIGLRVEEAPALTARVEVRNDAGKAVAMLAHDKAASVQRIEIPLGDPEETNLVIAFLKEDGKPVSELPLTLWRGDLRPRASTLSRPSVVAKDIALEVVRGDRRDRKVLLARGTGLPATVKHVFFTGDQSGAVVLRILQNRLPIHSLVVSVPKETPVGTPVDLTFTCDETMRMNAHAACAGKEVRAAVEPPALEAIGTEEDVEALLDEADQAGKKLWGYFASTYKRESEQLTSGIREVLGTDPDKTDALCRRLRTLIEEYRGGSPDELSPMSRFEENVDRLRRLVYRSSGSLLAMTRDQWEARIDTIVEKATNAHRENDSTTWRRSFNEIQALYETAHQEEWANTKQDDPSFVQRRLQNVKAYAESTERSLREFVPAQSDAIAMLQIAEQARLLAWLRDKALEPLGKFDRVDEKNVEGVRTLLSGVYPEIERVESGIERLPSIGLVTDRGQGG